MKKQDFAWLDKYPTGIDWDMDIPENPVFDLVDQAADKYPDNAAMDFLGNIYSYSQLKDLIDKAAYGLQQIGIVKGTRVGLFLPNGPHSIISYYAVLKAGGVVVNFSPLYSVPELKHQMEDSGVEIMITLNLKVLLPKVQQLEGVGKLRHIVVGTMVEALPEFKAFLFKTLKFRNIISQKTYAKRRSYSRFSDIIAESGKIIDHKIDLYQDAAVIQYTGGTTGVAKGAVLTHRNVYSNAVQSSVWFSSGREITKQDKVLAVLPFFHVFAMTTLLNMGMLRAACLITLPRFKLKQVMKTIDKKKPNLIIGVPTMFNAMLNYKNVKNIDLSTIELCVSGGAPLPADTKKRFEDMTSCKLVEGYGLTETSPVLSCNPRYDENKTGSIGMPFPNTEIVIENIEKRGEFLGVGKRGELCARGPQVMKEYLDRPDATKDSFINGFLRTGDIARMDEDGYFFIEDRLKDLIICGGFNVYPKTIEEAIYKHEAVLECAVIGVKDDYRGETPKAFVVLQNNATLEQDDLIEFLKARLGKHEIPKYIEFRDELPKTMVGKIDKKGLRDE